MGERREKIEEKQNGREKIEKEKREERERERERGRGRMGVSITCSQED